MIFNYNFCSLFSGKTIFICLSTFFIFLFGFNCFSQDDNIKKGKALFNTNCAACHKINKRAVGPALKGVSDKYEKEWLYTWIKNSTAMVKSGDARAVAIYEEYNGSVMTSFPQLSNEDIDNILAYTDYTPPAPVAAIQAPVVATQNTSNISNTIILSVLVLVLLLVIVDIVLVHLLVIVVVVVDVLAVVVVVIVMSINRTICHNYEITEVF